MSVNYESKTFGVASGASGNLQAVSYNSTGLWVASCDYE